MPIYEYFCPDCNLKFELLRPINQSNEVASCPRCHGNTERILSSFNALSENTKGESIPIGGSTSCSTCSALGCAACNGCLPF